MLPVVASCFMAKAAARWVQITIAAGPEIGLYGPFRCRLALSPFELHICDHAELLKALRVGSVNELQMRDLVAVVRVAICLACGSKGIEARAYGAVPDGMDMDGKTGRASFWTRRAKRSWLRKLTLASRLGSRRKDRSRSRAMTGTRFGLIAAVSSCWAWRRWRAPRAASDAERAQPSYSRRYSSRASCTERQLSVTLGSTAAHLGFVT
jgi:hypothetical protein